MAWTNVSKPGAQTWTDVHPQGKEQYDESTIEYDSADTFYDGINPGQWTDVSKPSYSLTWDAATFPWDSFDNSWSSPAWTPVMKPN